MSLEGQLCRPVCQPVCLPLNEVSAAIRKILTVDAAASAYGEISAWTAAGDFEVEITFSTTTGANQVLLGDDHTTNFYVNTAAATENSIKVWWLASSKVFNFSSDIDDGRLHVFKVVFSGGTLNAWLDGVAATENGSYTGLSNQSGALNLRLADANSLHDYFDGQILNVKLTDLETQSNSREYLLNSGSVYYELPAGVSIGSNDVDFSAGTPRPGWSFVNAITANWVGNGGDGYEYYENIATGLVAGQKYRRTITVSGYSGSGATVGFSAQGSGVNLVISGNGTVEDVVVADGAPFRVYGYNAVLSATVTVTVEAVPNAITFSNINTADWESFRRTYNPDAWTALDGSPVLEIAP